MFTGKLFLGLRAGKTGKLFNRVGIIVMTEKVISHCKNDIVFSCHHDTLSQFVVPAVMQGFDIETNSKNRKIELVTKDELLLFYDDEGLNTFAKKHEVNNIFVLVDSREIINIAQYRIEEFNFSSLREILIPLRKEQILCIDFGHKTIERF